MNKVIVACDGSAFSRLAETLVAKLPVYRDAEIHIVGVTPTQAMLYGAFQPTADMALAATAGSIYDQALEITKKNIGEAVERMKALGFSEVKAVDLQGSPGPELQDYAEQIGASLIALGSRGLSAVESFLLGSVSRRLLNHAHCDVLVARPLKPKTLDETLEVLQAQPKLNVLIGVDGSEGSQKAVDWLAQNGKGAFRQVVAACVGAVYSVVPGLDPSEYPEMFEANAKEMERIAAAALEQVGETGEQAFPDTTQGRVVETLMDVAEKTGTDLIVLGASRHGVLQRFFIGSVSFEVANGAPCSVYIKRPS
ncbi:MAG: universal stress protein [Fimbriimonadaceae bacterium]